MRTKIVLFLLICNFSVKSQFDPTLIQIALTATQELAELHELLTEAKKTNESLKELNEFMEEADIRVQRAQRIEAWYTSLKELGDNDVKNLSALNSQIRDLKSQREEISSILERITRNSYKSKTEIIKAEKREKAARKRAKGAIVPSSSVSSSKSALLNRINGNTGHTAFESSLINANLNKLIIEQKKTNLLLEEQKVSRLKERLSIGEIVGALTGEDIQDGGVK
ncbi:hypothetical protein A9Q84_00280 [Halobacteriovorax marinus]|uniref:Uncharacterized protein n=1 Tax=Halobacteriovorax marinus TaxID=97084 RepID=A0A1Y5FH72_9BACT|nr:hypothetical protein A9Q84_00280 [Halobacteriovorax marinus]